MNTLAQTDDQHFIDSMLFVLVIYNCRIAESVSFQSLQRIFSKTSLQPHFFIYDNSPVAQHFSTSEATIDYHHDSLNRGVSKAFNEGFRFAKALNKKWLILLDQDTVFPEDSFTIYRKNIIQYPHINIFVPSAKSKHTTISPFRLVNGKGKALNHLLAGVHSLEEKYFINSGLCISSDAFESAGGFDERFPLDYSDIVFVDRLKKKNRSFVLMELTCNHSLSANVDHLVSTSVVAARFKQFCSATKFYKTISNKKVNIALIILPRALKLSWMKKDIQFLAIVIKTWVGLS
jgi:rhamnosyltransferase